MLVNPVSFQLMATFSRAFYLDGETDTTKSISQHKGMMMLVIYSGM